jgi:transcriptional regulator with XRE-family HTH domain
MMARARKQLSDQIRDAVDDSGLSRYRICREIGLSESAMSRFMSGESGLSLANIDLIAELLDLNITVGRGRRRR